MFPFGPWGVRERLSRSCAFFIVGVLATAWHVNERAYQAVAVAEIQTVAQPEPQGTVAGQVVDGTSGRSVSNATVKIYLGRQSLSIYGERGLVSGPPLTVLTDPVGRFEIKVNAGLHTIRVSRPGYRSTGYLLNRREDGPAATIRVRSNERVEVRFRLWRNSSLEGLVVDETRDGLAGVEVTALRRTFSGGRPLYRSEAQTETNDQGRYRFPDLEPGAYVVAVASGSVTWPIELVREVHDADKDELAALVGRLGQSGAPVPAAGGMPVLGRVFDWLGPAGRLSEGSSTSTSSPLVYRTFFHPNATVVEAAAVVPVDEGQAITSIDIALGAPVETHPVTGRLSGPEGRIGGVAVSLVPAELEGLSSTRGFEIATAVTDTDGRFVILGVPAGRYVLRSTHGGRAWAPRPGSLGSLLAATPISATVFSAPDRSSEVIFTARAEVNVGDEPVRDISLALQPGRRVEGRLVLPTTGQPPSARHVVDTIVHLEPLDRAQEGSYVSARPNADGYFRTPDYEPGRYRLIISHVDSRWRIDQILVNGENVVDGFFELSDRDVTGVLVTLVDKEASLSGTVTGEAAKAIYPRIIVFPADIERWILRGMHPWWASNRVRANEAGEFQVSNMRPGRYLVAAMSTETRVELTNPEWIRQVAKFATPVEVGWTGAQVTLNTLVLLKR